MIDSSSQIALVEITKGGLQEVSMRPLKIYKGTLPSSIRTSGFSNPAVHGFRITDSLHVGEQYLVFFRSSPIAYRSSVLDSLLSKEQLEFVKDRSKMYQLWRGFGGYKIEKEQINCSLEQVEYFGGYSNISFSDFEPMLEAAISKKTAPEKWIKQRIQNIQDNPEMIGQQLILLQLAGVQEWFSGFDKLVESSDPLIKLEMAKYVLSSNAPKAQEVIIKLACQPSSHFFADHGFIDALKKKPEAFVEPILLELFNYLYQNSSGENPRELYKNKASKRPLNFPFTIKWLYRKKGQYSKTYPILLKLLAERCRFYIRNNSLSDIIEILERVGNKAYVPIIQEQLLDLENEHQTSVCFALFFYNNKSGVPYLKKYIEKVLDYDYDKYQHPDFPDEDLNFRPPSFIEGMTNVIDALAKFRDSTAVLDAYFLKLYQQMDQIHPRLIKNGFRDKWKERILYATLDEYGIKEAKPLIFEAFFNWTGYHKDFATHPELAKLKRTLEDSLSIAAKKLFPDFEEMTVKTIVFLENRIAIATQNATPKYRLIVGYNFPYSFAVTDNNRVLYQRIPATLSKKLKTPENRIIRINSAVSPFVQSDQFEDALWEGSSSHFYSYLRQFPEKSDVKLLELILENRNFQQSWNKGALELLIKDLKEQLK